MIAINLVSQRNLVNDRFPLRQKTLVTFICFLSWQSSVFLAAHAQAVNQADLLRSDIGPIQQAVFDRPKAISDECSRLIQLSHSDHKQEHREEALLLLMHVFYPYRLTNEKLLQVLQKEGVKYRPKLEQMTPAMKKLTEVYKIQAKDIDDQCNARRAVHKKSRLANLSVDYNGSVCATTYKWLKNHDKELKEQKAGIKDVLNELGWGMPPFLSDYLRGPYNQKSTQAIVTANLPQQKGSNSALGKLAADYASTIDKNWTLWLQDRVVTIYTHDIYPDQITEYPRGAWPR